MLSARVMRFSVALVLLRYLSVQNLPKAFALHFQGVRYPFTMDINASVWNATIGGLSEPSDGLTTVEPLNTPNYGWVNFQIVFYVLVIVVGALGNGFIIRVYSLKVRRVRTTTSVLVVALALSDLAVCVFRFRNLAILWTHLTGEPVPAAVLYAEVPDKVAIAATVALTGLIAFDRYDCVCCPLHRLLTYRSVLVAAAGCVAFSVLSNVPVVIHIVDPSFQPSLVGLLTPAFQVLIFSVTFGLIVVCYSRIYWRVRLHVRVGIGNRPDARPRVASVGDGSSQQPRAAPWLTSALASSCPTGGTPFTALSTPCTPVPSSATTLTDAQPCLTLTGMVPASLTVPEVATASASPESPSAARVRQPESRSTHQASSRPSGGRRRRPSVQRKTTRMLFITSVVFILTWLPHGVYVGTQLARANDRDDTPVSADAVFNLKPVLFLNNVINPLIYGLANRRFREDCADVLKQLAKSCLCRI